MIRSEFDAAISRWVARCSVRRCDAHVAGRTPAELHEPQRRRAMGEQLELL